ncbi:hypothetical protein DE146DRAFT_792111 [Phaeosphaeria sp. MPI-PUGE-AT-0046c]|nr:hypothetical protein DE146DRAFT_792111 [Phaeosphaeria sp. MPI-PUGE-AT-0046c]
MEGVAALGLAANILQIVDLAGKLLSTGSEIYQAGTTVENAELEVLTKDFGLLSTRLRSWVRPSPDTHGPLAEDDQSLEALALESGKISQELITVLLSLKSSGNFSRYKSFLQAIKTAWNSDKIKHTKQRLVVIQASIQLRIQILIREDQVRTKDEILHSLDEVTRNILLASLRDRHEVIKRQQASEALASARHNQMVDLITKRWDLSESSELKDVIVQIKAQLRYRRQNDRFDDIIEAHQNTFQWVLQESHSFNTTQPDLYTWLCEGQGIYWLSGKAGSAKSTLMKYLHQAPALQRALQSWTEGMPLIMLSFYFWNAGSDLQKSQEGLFRSMLSQVLDQDPSFGKVLFPEQFILGANWHGFPTFHELRRAFSRFTQNLDSRTKVMMLIDGLDEFDDISLTMTELAEMFIAATRSTHIKAILASRPLAPYGFSFRHHPKLRLHELTRTDITTFVNDKLAANPRISDLSADDARGVQELCKEIVDTAAGVFLWVRLVVRSLLEGLQNYDRLPDLQKRLRALPRDLESLFGHMLRSIPAEYQLESSQMFQIVTSHYRHADFALSASALGLVDERQVQVCETELPISELSEEGRHYIEEQVAGRLRSRCAGLLEIRTEKYPSSSYTDEIVPRVDFLHKSVADFLAREDIWAETLRHTQGTDFNAEMSLLQSAVRQVRCSKSDLGPGKLLWWHFGHAMAYARHAENSTKFASLHLLRQLDAHMTEHFAFIKSSSHLKKLEIANAGPVTNWYDCAALYEGRHKELWHENFMAMAIRYGLKLYVQAELGQTGRKGIQKRGRPLLLQAILPFDGRLFRLPAQNEIMECLLKHGANVMEEWCHRTMWEYALTIRLGNPFVWMNILKLFIDCGADTHLPVRDLRQERFVMRSAFGLIKHRLQHVMEGPSVFGDEWWNHPDYHEGAHLLAQVLTEAKAASEDLISCMVAHGAEDKYWLVQDSDSDSEAQQAIFEEQHPQQDLSDGSTPTEIKRSHSTRNPIKRLLQRIKS